MQNKIRGLPNTEGLLFAQRGNLGNLGQYTTYHKPNESSDGLYTNIAISQHSLSVTSDLLKNNKEV